jgi:hypothetical protein
MRRFLPLCLLLASLGATPPRARAEEPPEEFPPRELVSGTVRDTDVSAVFRLDAIKVARAPTPENWYGQWRLDVTVLRRFKGQVEPGRKLTIFWTYEAGADAPEAGKQLVGSVKAIDGDRYLVPDNGYVFAWTAALERRFEEASSGGGKTRGDAAPSAGKTRKASARGEGGRRGSSPGR